MPNKLIRAIRWRLTNAWKAKLFPSHLATPVATFTFDDFPRTAWLTGGAILEASGVRGTYFVAGVFDPGNLRTNVTTDTIPGIEYFQPEDIRSANENGHEIGCHTFDHCDVTTQSNQRINDNLSRNNQYLSGLLGDVRTTSFAYPRGEANFRTKTFLSRRYAACRGSWPGVNSGMVDLSQLRCYGLDNEFRRFSLPEIIATTKRNNGWLIFNTHDVSQSPSPYGCTPEELRKTVESVLDAGIQVLPMKNALAKVTFGN